MSLVNPLLRNSAPLEKEAREKIEEICNSIILTFEEWNENPLQSIYSLQSIDGEALWNSTWNWIFSFSFSSSAKMAKHSGFVWFVLFIVYYFYLQRIRFAYSWRDSLYLLCHPDDDVSNSMLIFLLYAEMLMCTIADKFQSIKYSCLLQSGNENGATLFLCVFFRWKVFVLSSSLNTFVFHIFGIIVLIILWEIAFELAAEPISSWSRGRWWKIRRNVFFLLKKAGGWDKVSSIFPCVGWLTVSKCCVDVIFSLDKWTHRHSKNAQCSLVELE